jgi:type IV secretory pathway VirB6-like protein
MELKYFSITVRVKGTNIQFQFKDSLKFLLKSIDKSAKALYDKDNAGIENFKNLTSYFHDTVASNLGYTISNEILELLVQKGVFPYSYLDSFDMLESTEYPNYDSFCDNLKDKNIEIKEYERRKNYGIILTVRVSKNIWNYI